MGKCSSSSGSTGGLVVSREGCSQLDEDIEFFKWGWFVTPITGGLGLWVGVRSQTLDQGHETEHYCEGRCWTLVTSH